MTPNNVSRVLRILFIALICIFADVATLSAQNRPSSPSPRQLRQEIERLESMLENRQRMLRKEESRAAKQARSRTSSSAGQSQKSQQQQPQPSPQQPIRLRPVDTGQSVASFDLGGTADRKLSSRPGRFQIKTNLLYAGAAMAPNLALEFGLGRRTSIEVSAGYNGWGNLWDYSKTGPDWDPDNRYKSRLDHIFGKIEFRYWLRNRFKGHFFGVGTFYTDYHIGDIKIPLLFDRQFDYNGYGVGAGLSYGYSWRMSRVFAMEFTLGGGIAMLRYDKSFIEADNETFRLIDTIRFRKIYLGPTYAGIKLVFTIK